jgi:hypothetical protein
MSRDKVHQPYIKKSDEKVPSVTQLLGNHLGWSQHALLAWTRARMNEGLDPIRLRDHAGEVGTVAHGMIEQDLTGKVFPMHEYPATAITVAEVAFDAWKSFRANHELKTEHAEIPLVHEILNYGGTIDWTGWMNDEKCLIDFKTSNNVYASHRVQAVAYQELYNHVYGEKLPLYILHLDKENGGYQLHSIGSPEKHFRVFEICLELNELKRELNA